jgi:hypothetical protein
MQPATSSWWSTGKNAPKSSEFKLINPDIPKAVESRDSRLAGKKKNPKISKVEPVTPTIRMRQQGDMGIP